MANFGTFIMVLIVVIPALLGITLLIIKLIKLIIREFHKIE